MTKADSFVLRASLRAYAAYSVILGFPALFFVGLAFHSHTTVNITCAALLSTYFILMIWWLRTCRITLKENLLEYYSGLEGMTQVSLKELSSFTIETSYRKAAFRPTDLLLGAFFSLVIRGGTGGRKVEISVPANAFSRDKVEVFLSELKHRTHGIDTFRP